MEKRFIMAIDQGTTSTRVIFFNREGQIHSTASEEIRQIYEQPGWVAHNPMEYWSTVVNCTQKAMSSGNVKVEEIAAIGITCQRETTVMWEKSTGNPVADGICWQCRRTSHIVDELKEKGHDPMVRERTGLLLDAYFSGTKIKWILDNVDGVREKAEKGEILFGNIDTWIIWKLSGGKYHVTDYTNASRTLLLNIHTLKWDEELAEIMTIPMGILPEVKPSIGTMAYTDKNSFLGVEIPIAGDFGDQQSATFGQVCFEPGEAKNTYGTSLALMMNIGHTPTPSKNGLTTDLFTVIDGKPSYAFEGVVNVGGAVIQWLRDGLGIIQKASESSELAAKVDDTLGVYLVPAFVGMCAPYWDQYARGLMIGITRGTTKEHIARAALESIAYQLKDNLDAMTADSGVTPQALRVDGGATASEFLMQFQSDILGIPLLVPSVTEMAALGCAYAAGLGVGFWKSQAELKKLWKVARTYEPNMERARAQELYAGWQRAVERSFKWAD